MNEISGLFIYFYYKKIVEVIVGPVSMWITLSNERKYSLSTCGQTVSKRVKVIHSIKFLKVH